MKTKTLNKIYIISAVFILLVFGTVLFVVWPTFNDIKKSSAELFSVKQNIFSLKKEIAGLVDFQKKYKDYQPNLEKIDRLFVDTKSPIDFIQFLEKTSLDSGVHSQISMPPNLQTQSDGAKWPFITFRINSKGSLEKILQLSKKLEASPYLIEVQGLSTKETASTISATGSLKNAKETASAISDTNLSREFNASFLIKVFTK